MINLYNDICKELVVVIHDSIAYRSFLSRLWHNQRDTMNVIGGQGGKSLFESLQVQPS